MPYAPDLSGVALEERYELHELIGEGTFGRVYRGRDRRLARWVAIKVIKPWWAEDPQWARNFGREAQLLASISHPGIIQIFDVGAADEGLYYVAELVEGESLARRLQRGPLPSDEAGDVAIQLARALACAHSQWIVHRDIKPANILITPEGRVKVGDFGVARLAAGSSDGVSTTIAGTPAYMAPEQASGGEVTAATDVYAVGVILYEMLAGAQPFAGTSAVELAIRHLHDRPPPLPARTPSPIAAVVARALSKDPAKRYANGQELADALADAVHGRQRGRRVADVGRANTPAGTARHTGAARGEQDATQLAPPRPPRRNFNPPERRQRIALLILAALIVAGMATGALLLAPGDVKVPNLHGLTKTRIVTLASRDHFAVSFDGRYSSAKRFSALAQSPAPGTRVGDGATVRVVLSRGPRPVMVPQLLGTSIATAQSLLQGLKLHASIREVPAPGVATGTVTRQAPAAGSSITPGSTVSLSAAEAPRLRAVTTLSGEGAARTGEFRIRGRRWQLVYSMSYDGMCTFIFFCSGPNAKITNASSGATVDSFGLGDGENQTRSMKSGPGVYELSVSPGSDTASWKIQIDDYY